MKKIFAIVAHPDDEIIGVAGTLKKHVNAGDEVHVLILGDGRSSRRELYKELSGDKLRESTQETKLALKTLGITKFYKETLPDNRFDTVPLLDIVKIVSGHIQKFQPDIIYTHYYGDLNVDHQMTAEAVIIAIRPIEYPKLERLLMFETLSSTEMAGPRVSHVFVPNVFVNITDELDDKIKAMSFYTSELKEFPHTRSLKAIEYNAKVWGAKNNVAAAEPFYLFRQNVW